MICKRGFPNERNSAERGGEILKILKILKMLKILKFLKFENFENFSSRIPVLGPALRDYRASMLVNNERKHTIIPKFLTGDIRSNIMG